MADMEKKLRATLELNSGDFSKDMKNVTSMLKAAEAEVKKTDNAIKRHGESTQTLSKHLTALNKQYDLQKSKVEMYRLQLDKANKTYEQNIAKKAELEKQMKESVKIYGESSEQVKALEREMGKLNNRIEGNARSINKYNTDLSRAEDQLDKTQKELADVNRELEKQPTKWDKASKSLDNYSKKLGSAGKKINELGTALVKGGALILTAFAGGAKTMMDFETGLTKVNTIAKLGQTELTLLGEQIKNISNKTGVGVSDLLEAEYQALSAGIAPEKSVQFLDQAVKLAKGGFTDAAKSIDLLTTVLNAYGLEATETSKVSDILISTQNIGKTTVDELASSMGKLIPTAKGAGVNLENISSGMALLTKKGISTSESVTYLNSMINELSKSSTTVAKTLKKETGKSFSDLVSDGYNLAEVLSIVEQSAKSQGLAFNDMFGSVEASKAAITIMSNDGLEFIDILGQMGNSLGATQEAFDTVANTKAEELKRTMNELKNSFIRLGEASVPILENVTECVGKLTDAINNADKETIDNVLNMGKWALILGVGAKAVGGATIGIANFAGVLSSVTAKIAGAGGFTSALTTGLAAINPITAAITILGGGVLAAWSRATYVQNERQKELNKTLKKTNEVLANGITPDDIGSAELEIADLSPQIESLRSYKDALNAALEEKDTIYNRLNELNIAISEGVASKAQIEEAAKLESRLGTLNDEVLSLQGSVGSLTNELTNSYGSVEAAEEKYEAYSKAIKLAKDDKELLSKVTSEYVKAMNEEANSLERGAAQAGKLSKEYSDLTAKEKLSKEEKQRLKQVEQELVDIFGDSIILRNKEGEAIGVNLGLVQQEIDIQYSLSSAKKRAVQEMAMYGAEHVRVTRENVKKVIEALKLEAQAMNSKGTMFDYYNKDGSSKTTAQIAALQESKNNAKKNLGEFEMLIGEYDKLLGEADRIEGKSANSFKGASSNGSGAGSTKNTEKVKENLKTENELKLEHAKKWLEEEKYYNRLSLEEEEAAYKRMLGYCKGNAEETKMINREIYRVQQQLLDQEVEAVKTATDKKKKARQEEYNQQLAFIDQELAAELKGYQAQLDAMDRQEQEERRREKIQQHEEKMTSLQDKLSGATTDAERNAIINEMNSETKEFEKWQREEERRKEREKIQEQMELARQKAQAEKDLAKTNLDDFNKNLDIQQQNYINFLNGKTTDATTTEQGLTLFLQGEYANRNILFKNSVDADVAYLQNAMTIMQKLWGSVFGSGKVAMPSLPTLPKSGGKSTGSTTNSATTNNMPINMYNTYNVGSNVDINKITTQQQKMLVNTKRNLGR